MGVVATNVQVGTVLEEALLRAEVISRGGSCVAVEKDMVVWWSRALVGAQLVTRMIIPS